MKIQHGLFNVYIFLSLWKFEKESTEKWSLYIPGFTHWNTENVVLQNMAEECYTQYGSTPITPAMGRMIPCL